MECIKVMAIFDWKMFQGIDTIIKQTETNLMLHVFNFTILYEYSIGQ